MKLLEKIKYYIFPIIIGACSLAVLSTFQKIASQYPLKMSGYILPILAGSLAGLLFALLRVREKEYLKTIEKKNIRLNTIYETSQCGLMIIDANTMNITSANPSVTTLLNCKATDIIGKKCYDLISCDYILNDCQIKKFKHYNLKQEKSRIHFLNTDCYIMRKGKLIEIDDNPFIIISFMDISEIVKSQQLVQKANERVQKADRLKTEFMMNIGHEIRTPLNAIIGISDLLIDSEISVELKEDIELIKNSGLSLLKTLENIIDYSILKTGNYTKNESMFNLYELLIQMASMYKESAEEKGLSFVVQLDDCQYISVIADKYAFNKIINNVLENAVKFTETGSITLECQLSISDSPQINLRVSDTGIGIPENQNEYIFDAFYQVNGSIRRQYEGTGMGLAIADFYVRQSDGTISFESEIDKGTTFVIQLPVELSTKKLL